MENIMQSLHSPQALSQPSLDAGQPDFAMDLGSLAGFRDFQGSFSPTNMFGEEGMRGNLHM
jgi:hypothetical protein